MKIDHKISFEGDKLIERRTFDNNPYLKNVEELRRAGVGQTGESRLVGRLPTHIVSQWLKEAGLKWDDHEAVKDLIRTKMLSGDFDKFRVWSGTY